MPRKIRIVVADDHAMVRKGFGLILSREPDMEVIAETGLGKEAVRLARELKPSLIVMDVGMPDLNGVEATRQIAELAPEVPVLILSMYKDAVYVRESLRAGVRRMVSTRDWFQMNPPCTWVCPKKAMRASR